MLQIRVKDDALDGETNSLLDIARRYASEHKSVLYICDTQERADQVKLKLMHYSSHLIDHISFLGPYPTNVRGRYVDVTILDIDDMSVLNTQEGNLIDLVKARMASAKRPVLATTFDPQYRFVRARFDGLIDSISTYERHLNSAKESLENERITTQAWWSMPWYKRVWSALKGSDNG